VQAHAHEVIHQVIGACHICENIAHKLRFLIFWHLPVAWTIITRTCYQWNILKGEKETWMAIISTGILLPFNSVSSCRVSPHGTAHCMFRSLVKGKPWIIIIIITTQKILEI
jgi:hypothetical protein